MPRGIITVGSDQYGKLILLDELLNKNPNNPYLEGIILELKSNGKVSYREELETAKVGDSHFDQIAFEKAYALIEKAMRTAWGNFWKGLWDKICYWGPAPYPE